MPGVCPGAPSEEEDHRRGSVLDPKLGKRVWDESCRKRTRDDHCDTTECRRGVGGPEKKVKVLTFHVLVPDY